MPYIDKDSRERYKYPLMVLDRILSGNDGPGDLNYIISKIALAYLPDDPSYKDYNEIIGVLESAKLELYRRKVAMYEDEKTEENGDIF